MRKQGITVLILIIQTVIAGNIWGQSHLSEPLSSGIYHLIEYAELIGTLKNVSAVRPFPLSGARSLLREAASVPGPFSAAEREILNRLTVEKSLTESKPVNLNVELETGLNVRAAPVFDYHSFNLIDAALFGGFGRYFSYSVNGGITYDRVNSDCFVPYEFTKQWDGFHFGSEEDKYSSGENTDFSFSFRTNPEMAFRFWEDRITLRFARLRREWGMGEGSILLSGSARPFDAVEGMVRLTDFAALQFLTGSLGDWTRKAAEQKMLSAHQLELFPLPWLYLSAWETSIWGKRFELSYLNPLFPYYIAQNTIGDLDNLSLGLSTAVTIPRIGRWYFSFFADEVEIDKPGIFFANPKNQYAFQTGIKVPLSFIPFSIITLQYTKIEPYCYTHYPQDYVFFSGKINTGYTHDGENLGYPLPPNSDEILLVWKAVPVKDLFVELKFKHIRHGDGDCTLGQIEGDIDTWLDYGDLASYPDKDFLNDGIYERISVFSIGGKYTLPEFPLEVGLGYSYVYADNFENIPGNTIRRHLFSLEANVSLFNE